MDSIALTTSNKLLTRVRVKRPGERRSLSRSATRALDVLEFFGEARRPLRAIEISKMLTMHPSTTNQLLKTMVDSAHLVFDAHNKTYLPSPRLATFSTWIGETYGAGGRLRDLIRDVHARTHMITTITTPNDLFMQVIDVAHAIEQKTERGIMVSVFGSVIGDAYLSTLAEPEIKRLAMRARVPTADIPATLRNVSKIRQDAYAEGSSTGDTMWSIAMPLPMQGVCVATVLGIAGPPDAMRKNLIPLIHTMNDAIKRWCVNPAVKIS